MNQTATTTVYINNEPAKQALSDLQDKLNDVNKAKQDAFEKGDFAALKKLDKEAKSLGAEAERLKKRFFDVNMVLKDLSGASLNDLQKALKMVQADFNKMSKTDPGFGEMKGKVDKLREAVDKAKDSSKTYGTESKSSFKQIRDVFVGFGLAELAGKAFGAIKDNFMKMVNSTKDGADKFEFAMRGAKEGLDFFYKTMSTGDINFNTFLENMAAAIKMGYDYAKAMDEVKERTMALTMKESDYLDLNVELEIAMRNRQLSDEERLEAGRRRMDNEETMSRERLNIAKKDYDAQRDMLKQRTGLSESQLLDIAKFNSEEVRMQGENYNELLTQAKEFEDLMRQQRAAGGGFGQTPKPYQDIQAQMKEFTPEAISYAQALRAYGSAAEEMITNFGRAYTGVNQAISSKNENTRKVQTMINSLLAETTDAEKKAAEEKRKEMQKQIDAQNKYIEEIIKSGMTLTERENADYKERLEKAGLFWVTKQSLTREELLKEGKINEKQYQALGILAQQHADNIIKIDKDWHDKVFNAQADYINALLENMAEGFEQEEAMEVERWENEKKRLEDKLIDKKVLSDEEVAYNDFIKLTIEEREQAHQNKLKEIRDMAAIQVAEIKVLEAETEDQEYQAKIQLAQQRYQADFNAANGNRLKELQAQKKYSEEIVALESEKIDRLKEMRMRNLSNVDNYLGILGTMVKKESALGKALFIASKAIAIAKIWVEVAASNAKILAAANAAAIPTFGASLVAGVALVAENKLQAALNTGLIAAQTISEVVGHKDGGYTRRDNSNSTPVGIVHANEFVASAPAVNNPTVKPVLDIIDMAQRSGTIRSINLSSVIKRGFQDGGFTSDGSGQPSQSGSGADQNTLTLAVLAQVINRLNDKLDNLYVKLVMDEFMNELKNYNDMKDDVSK